MRDVIAATDMPLKCQQSAWCLRPRAEGGFTSAARCDDMAKALTKSKTIGRGRFYVTDAQLEQGRRLAKTGSACKVA